MVKDSPYMDNMVCVEHEKKRSPSTETNKTNPTNVDPADTACSGRKRRAGWESKAGNQEGEKVGDPGFLPMYAVRNQKKTARVGGRIGPSSSKQRKAIQFHRDGVPSSTSKNPVNAQVSVSM